MFLRKYGTGTGADVIIPIIKRGVVDFAVTADWTPASGDVKVSKDGAAEANIGTLPVINGTVGWKFVFSDAELQCKSLTVRVVDSATKAVEDQFFIVETYGNASAMFQADLSAANLPVNVTQFGGTNLTATAGIPSVNTTQVSGTAQTAGDIYASQVAIAGYIDTEVSAIKAKTDNLPSDPADQSAVESAITAATSPLATQASVNTIDDFLDTEIAAIKTKTDQLTFTTANKVDSTAELDSATQTKVTNIENASGYLLAVLAGACADPQTASETYAITVFGSTFTVDMAGQTSAGVRTAPALTKT